MQGTTFPQDSRPRLGRVYRGPECDGRFLNRYESLEAKEPAQLDGVGVPLPPALPLAFPVRLRRDSITKRSREKERINRLTTATEPKYITTAAACSCPDAWYRRGRVCKHVKAIRQALELLDSQERHNESSRSRR